MEITLNHTIIPSQDNVKSARFYARIFGFDFFKEWEEFAMVRVNSTLTLDFEIQEGFKSIHYAFKVSEEQFDEIFERIKTDEIVYGSGPFSHDDGEINHKYEGRGVYFLDPNGHVLEMITTDYVIE